DDAGEAVGARQFGERARVRVEGWLGDPPCSADETEAYLADVAERLYRYFETVAPLFVQLATHTAFHSDYLADAHQPMIQGLAPADTRDS
ncbi:MAG: hypothetical protein MJE12_24180, partial [Alphaproteobacteria bacterium]|nr:hypothetical protein [Alphaproteobacteria bacterium]